MLHGLGVQQESAKVAVLNANALQVSALDHLADGLRNDAEATCGLMRRDELGGRLHKSRLGASGGFCNQRM